MLKFLNKNKIVLISIVVAILVEICICNYPAIRTILSGEKEKKVEFTLKNYAIEIEDINSRVTSLQINYKNELTDKITYKTSYKSIENSAEFNLRDKVILKDGKHYINFDTHAKCLSIRIDLMTESDIVIKNIVINKPCFNISIWRIIVLYCIVLIIQKIVNKEAYKICFDYESKRQDVLFLLILLITFLIILDYALVQFGSEKYFFRYEEISHDDALLMQTEAFLNGKAKLMIEPSKEILEMDDPYDSKKRDEEGVSYAYDMAFYNGKYYSYFGIAPIITLILPFRIITGGYTHCYIYNLVYTFGVMIFLYLLYKKLVRKYIGKTSLFNFYLGYYAIFFGANVLTLLRGMKYDIVVTSGLMFLLISLNLAISIEEKNKFRVLKLLLLGLSTGLIVLSKPNLIVYYVLMLYLILNSIKTFTKKEKIRDLIIISLPLGILAIIQMIYNYARFDSIFEFGARYQLTGFNMNYCMGFTFGKMFTGILEYIFKLPEIRVLEFPFVFINNGTKLFRANELLYENRLYGLIAIPILWILLFKKQILKNDKIFGRITNVAIITSLLSIIVNTACGGVCEVYAIDFKLILCIISVITLLKLVENDKAENNKLYLILCIITIILMIPISFTTENNFLTNFGSDSTIYIKNIFEFWN